MWLSNPQKGLTRRDTLRLFGAAGLATVLPTRALSANSLPATAEVTDTLQGAGFYAFKVGSFECALVSDGMFPFSSPFPLFGANASREAVESQFKEAFIPYDHVTAHVNALVVKTGKDIVLVDTGCGSLFGPTTGLLTRHLVRFGIKLEEVTVVVITHAHLDHIGGLGGPGGAGVFPNAQFIIHERETAFWLSPNPDLSKCGAPAESKKQMIAGAAGILKAIQPRSILVGDKAKVVDGIEIVPAPGHTPGHFGLSIDSGSEQLLYITDAVHHHAIGLPQPDWHVAFDTDPVQAVQARRALLDRSSTDRVLVSGAHLPFPGLGHVRTKGNGFEWVPVVWDWA